MSSQLRRRSFLGGTLPAFAQQNPAPVVRIAEIEIDPVHLEAYKSALREEIESSLRLEPGVLTLHAVALAEAPQQIRIFETYASRAGYESHLQTPHFLKYKSSTQHMVKSLKLIDVTPISALPRVRRSN